MVTIKDNAIRGATSPNSRERFHLQPDQAVSPEIAEQFNRITTELYDLGLIESMKAVHFTIDATDRYERNYVEVYFTQAGTSSKEYSMPINYSTLSAYTAHALAVKIQQAMENAEPRMARLGWHWRWNAQNCRAEIFCINGTTITYGCDADAIAKIDRLFTEAETLQLLYDNLSVLQRANISLSFGDGVFMFELRENDPKITRRLTQQNASELIAIAGAIISHQK